MKISMLRTAWCLLFLLTANSTACGASPLVEVNVQGQFGGFSGQYLPESTYPFPQLLGGSFRGRFSYESEATRILDNRFPYVSVEISIFDRNGSLLHTIDTGPSHFVAGFGGLVLFFGASSGVEAINKPEDLRLVFNGPFPVTNPHPPNPSDLLAAKFSPLDSIIEVDGAEGSYWDLEVTSAELTVVPEPASLLLWACALVPVLTATQRHMGELQTFTRMISRIRPLHR
jgi:hypothetical protein